MKRWVWYIVAATVFALAAGGVIYGVITHKEAGLLKVCWKGGIAHYSPNCEGLKWKKEQMPLPYYIDFKQNHTAYVDSVVTAAEMWNREIGPVFQRTNHYDDAKVIVSWGAYSGAGHDCAAGYVKHRGYRGPVDAQVVLRNPSDTHAVFRFAAHEFGHVLGLAHDESGLMAPTMNDTTDELKITVPTDHDKKLLRRLYR
jgi:hypothetical protein